MNYKLVISGSDAMSSGNYPQQPISDCSARWTDLLGWMPEGTCQHQEEAEYFRSDSTSKQNWAKRICRGCPVRSQCLQWSLETPETSGVWGGLTARERRAVAAIAHDGSWRTEVARKPWCPWCTSRDVSSPEDRRLECNGCGFNWPGLMPVAVHPSEMNMDQAPAPAMQPLLPHQMPLSDVSSRMNDPVT